MMRLARRRALAMRRRDITKDRRRVVDVDDACPLTTGIRLETPFGSLAVEGDGTCTLRQAEALFERVYEMGQNFSHLEARNGVLKLT